MNRILNGHRVAITGALTGPLRGLHRQDAFRLIESLGGIPSKSVSSSTTLLVSSRFSTVKIARATKLGVKIISSSDLAVLLGNRTLW